MKNRSARGDTLVNSIFAAGVIATSEKFTICGMQRATKLKLDKFAACVNDTGDQI
jgi:hypothetical protein